jgi:thermostable 8-oxoguanine DNA glycosylase
LIYVIRNQFSNHPPTHAHDNKNANELSARMTEINGILIAEIEKNKTRDGSITAEIERLLTDVYKKLSTEVNTKIANELFTCLSEINSTFTTKLDRINNDLNNKLNEEVNVGLGKINTELNSKLTAEIENFKARDAEYVTEAQKIFARLFNIEEARRNDFGRITFLEKGIIDSIDDLYKKINQCYAEI